MALRIRSASTFRAHATRPCVRTSSAMLCFLSSPFVLIPFSPCLSLLLSPPALILLPAPLFCSVPSLCSCLCCVHLCAPLRPLLQTAGRSEGEKSSIGDNLKQLIRRAIRKLSPEWGFKPNNAPFAVETQPHAFEVHLIFPGSTRAVVTNRDFFVQSACRALQVSCMRCFLHEAHRARSVLLMTCTTHELHRLFRMCLWTYLFLSRL